jgi:hypothetical protein
MTSEEFVGRIQVAVYDSSVEGCVLTLEDPPGRRPSTALVGLSQWFTALSSKEKARVRATIQLAVRSAIFGMLTVLDGVTSIRTDEEEVPTLEFWCKTT